MKKLALPIALILVGVATLLVVSILSGGIAELQVRDLSLGDWSGKEVKVHGLLHEIEHGQRPLRFRLRDKTDPSKVIDVHADATRPDTFQVSYDVAVQGRWVAGASRFEADHVFTKCPSKYEAIEAKGIGSEESYRKAGFGDPPADRPE